MGMSVVLPNEGIKLPDVEAELLADTSESWRKDFEEGSVSIELPRFKLEYEKSLVNTLQALGMKQAFSPKTADFSAMTDPSNNLYVSGILHKSFIEVNETGTEAAAVTGLQMAGSAEPPKETFEFRVDRPFFFAIEDRKQEHLYSWARFGIR